jgi:hypothetical protein
MTEPISGAMGESHALLWGNNGLSMGGLLPSKNINGELEGYGETFAASRS